MRKLFLFFFLFIISVIVKAQTQTILIPYRVGDKWGYSDSSGRMQIPAVFEKVYLFSYPDFPVKEIYALTKNGNDVYTVINSKGKPVMSGVYSDVRFIYRKKDAVFIVRHKGGKLGVVGLKGELIPAEYDEINVGAHEEFIAYKNREIWIFDAGGKKIMQGTEDEVMYKEEVSTVNVDGPPAEGDYEFPRKSGDSDWEKQIANKYGAEQMKRIDAVVHLPVTALYKKDSQAVIFPYNKTVAPYFFPDTLSIKRMIMLDSTDRSKFGGEALIIVGNRQEKLGLMTNRTNFILPVEYEKMNYYMGNSRIEFIKNFKHGILFLNSLYSMIPATYNLINDWRTICVNKKSCFRFFKVWKEGVSFYVGENGKEYYSPN